MTGVDDSTAPGRPAGRFSAGWPIAMAAAGAILAVANGQFAHPLATWIAPALFVATLRSATVRRAILIGYPVYLIAWLVPWHGVFRIGPLELAPLALFLSLMGYIPLLLDRLAAPRLPALASTLVFPCANCLVEYVIAEGSPFGAWGLIAYSQADLPIIAQTVALVGAVGLGFVILWASALAATLWQNRHDASRRAALAAMLCALLLGVLAYGHFRLRANGERPGITVAMVLPPYESGRNYEERLASEIIDAQFALTETAAAKGARLVLWPEDSFFIRGTAEAALLARAQDLARKRNIHLGLTYGVRFEPTGLRYFDRSVLVAPDGSLAWRYDKSFVVPGYESRHMVVGAGLMPAVVTPAGIVAGAICFDADHNGFLRQARDAAFLLLPSDDWPAIRHLHARMARLRGIELGLPIVRPAINGISFVTDRVGRVAAWADSRDEASRLTLGTIVPDTRRTLYSRSAAVLPWLSLVGLIVLLAVATLRRRNAPKEART